MDEDEEEDHQTWVEALSQELADEDPEEDPDYEVGALCFLNHNTDLNTHSQCITITHQKPLNAL